VIDQAMLFLRNILNANLTLPAPDSPARRRCSVFLMRQDRSDFVSDRRLDIC